MIDERLYEAVRGCIRGGKDQWDDVYNELVTASPAAQAQLSNALNDRLTERQTREDQGTALPNDSKLTMRLPAELHDALRRAAEEERRPLSRVIRDAFEQWLERRDQRLARLKALERAFARGESQ